MSPVALAILVCIVTLGVGIVFAVERARKRRFFPRLRGFADRSVTNSVRTFSERTPQVNRTFFRQFFHYLVHRFLSRIIKVLKGIEKGMTAVVRLNRKKATERVPHSTGTHLQKIAEHKEEVALTEKEKKTRKDAALRGDAPQKKENK